MADMHEATLVWPEVDAKEVIVTGTFDQWSSSIHLTKTPGGFQGKVKIPWGDRILYKFVVDGRWVTAQSQPEETDSAGNVNNVYESPSKPQPPTTRVPPTNFPLETTQPKHNEIAEASVPASLTASAAEQQTLPEKAAQVAHQVKETVVTATQDVLPESTGPVLDQAHATVVAPVVEAAQKVAADPAGTLDQVKQSVPPVVGETTQKVVETLKTAAVQAEATVTPVVAPMLHEAREALTGNTPVPVKEQVTSTSEKVQGKGSDPINADKIPVATPTPTHDAFVVSPQEHLDSPTIPTPASQTGSDLEPSGPVSSDAATVPAINAVYPTAPTSIFAEPPPVVPAPTDAATETSTPTPSIPTPKNQSDAPSETLAVDQAPVPNDIRASEPAKDELPPAPIPVSESTAVSEAPTVPESTTTVTEAPAAVDPAATPPAPAATFETESAQAKTDPTLDSTPETIEPVPSTADASHTEAPVVTEPEAAVDASAVTPANAATPRTEPVQTEAKSPEQSAAPTNGPIQAAKPTLASAIPEKATNGHSPPATDPATPSKTPEASGSDKSHAFPTTESKMSSSTTSSPAPSSKFGSARKKRVSIFGKVKNLFTSDKEEKKDKK